MWGVGAESPLAEEGVSAKALRWECTRLVLGKQGGCGSIVGEKEWRKSEKNRGSHGELHPCVMHKCYLHYSLNEMGALRRFVQSGAISVFGVGVEGEAQDLVGILLWG